MEQFRKMRRIRQKDISWTKRNINGQKDILLDRKTYYWTERHTLDRKTY